MVILRDYQQDNLDKIFYWLINDSGNLCVDLPTGAGKSHVIAALCKTVVQRWPAKILMLTHVKELIEQNYQKMIEHWPNAPVAIYSASVGKKQIDAITFAGIQSIVKKIDELEKINIVIIDECHLISHKNEGNYRKIIDALKAKNEKLRIIGFTATPFRLGHGMINDGDHAIFNKILKTVTVDDLVEKGYLSPLRSKKSLLQLDVSSVKKTAGEYGEYNQHDLQEMVDVADKNHLAVDEIIKNSLDRKSWLIFCSGVQHCKNIRDLIVANGFSCESIFGDTPKKEREEIIRAYKSGEITALTNANVLTTGFDTPNVDLIALLRPTLSTALHVQMLGRGTRIKQNAENCLVLDFCGNIFRHGGISEPIIKTPAKNKKENSGESPMKDCPNCFEIIHTRIMKCPNCQHEFEEKSKIFIKKYENYCPMSGNEEKEPEKMTVKYWNWFRHISKKTNHSMIRISYYSEDVYQGAVDEYFCINHEGYAKKKALEKLEIVCNNSGIVFSKEIDNIQNFVHYANQNSKKPKEIIYQRVGKFMEIRERIWE